MTGNWPGRREFAGLIGGAAAAGLLGSRAARSAPAKGGTINVATPGEPPTLDPMQSTADVVGMIGQHIFETLYTWGDGWRIVPLLAAAGPAISEDGKSYTIQLRSGVRFHDGSSMTSADVLASLNRWLSIAQRGQQTKENIESLTAPDANTIRFVLKHPYAPLMSFLALETSAAIILPASKQSPQMTEPVGTGPFRFVERVPDRYVRVRRFDDYSSRDEPPSGYGGRRTPWLDEIRFVPVPNASTRVAGSISGEYDYADSLPTETMPRLQAAGAIEPLVFRSFGWPLFFCNLRQGPMTNAALRRAVLASLNFEEMLTAAFGSREFFVTDPAYYPAGFALHSDAGSEVYKAAGDTARANRMAADAGYKGEKIRILVSQQYDFHYKLAEVAANEMQAAGLNAATVVVDWATLLTQRNDASLWDIYVTHGPILPEPTLYSFMTPTAPGWWSTPARDAAAAAFNAEPNPAKRAELWANLQALIYQEVPIIRMGNFNALAVHAKRLQGVVPAAWPFFWNTWVASP